MGSLYWQLNDCWGVISWSGTDYYGRPKALQYFVKKAFKDNLISFEQKNDIVKVFVISDKLKKHEATLALKLMDFDEFHLKSKGNADDGFT